MHITFCLILILLSLPTIAEQPFFIAMSDGTVSGTLPESDISFSIDVADAEVATLNTGKGHIWVYGNQRLQSYHPDGSQLIDQYHPDLPANNSAADLGVGYNSVWLAINRTLYQFDEDGILIKRRVFRTSIRAIHFDIKKSQILVTTPKYVFVLDSEGHQLKKIRTHLPNIA
jgi:hypothetical protein